MHARSYFTAHALTALLPIACSGESTERSPSQILPNSSTTAVDGYSGDSADRRATVRDAGPIPLPWATAPFPEPTVPAENPTTEEKIELGHLLFYDPIVSADGEVACATCHSEDWGMSDGLPVSVGIGAGLKAGPGRRGPHRTRRNASTIWNVAFRQDSFMDGRATSLEDQVPFPFASSVEFAKPLADVIQLLANIPAYVVLFQAAFPEDPAPVSELNFTRAVAAFERSLISNRALYDAYLEGDAGAMSEQMLSGMNLFAESGCVGCHVPPLFASERFEHRGVRNAEGVDDLGRYEVTGADTDRGRFKVPTLRNLHVTGPYFHNGSVATPLEAVQHEVEYSVQHDGARSLGMTEIEDLTHFILKALFDTGRGPARPREVPSGLPVPIDGFNILR